MILNEFKYEISVLQEPLPLTEIHYAIIIISIDNYINIAPWDVITHPCPKSVFETTIDIKTWTGQYIHNEPIYFHISPRLNLSYACLVQRTPPLIANNCDLIRMYEEPTHPSLLIPYISGDLVCCNVRCHRTVVGSPVLRHKVNSKCDKWSNVESISWRCSALLRYSACVKHNSIRQENGSFIFCVEIKWVWQMTVLLLFDLYTVAQIVWRI